MTAVYVLIAIAALMFMIVVHELGHYLAGRALKFKITEFAVGMGPAVFKRISKKTGIKYSLRCLPIGGFCSFAEDGDDNPFDKQKPWKRIVVLASGAIFNFIAALILITIFFSAYGNCYPNLEVYNLTDGTTQNLKTGDVVLEVNGERLWYLVNPNGLYEAAKAGETLTVKIFREGEGTMELTLEKGLFRAPGEAAEKLGYGFSIRGMTPMKINFFQAVGDAFIFMFKAVGQLFATLGGLFTGALGLKGTLGGPVMAVQSIVNVAQTGWAFLLYGVCVLSANLAVLNLLPIPSLDGSRIVFTAAEWIRKKPVNKKFERAFHTIGLLFLFAFAIVMDIVNLIPS